MADQSTPVMPSGVEEPRPSIAQPLTAAIVGIGAGLLGLPAALQPDADSATIIFVPVVLLCGLWYCSVRVKTDPLLLGWRRAAMLVLCSAGLIVATVLAALLTGGRLRHAFRIGELSRDVWRYPEEVAWFAAVPVVLTLAWAIRRGPREHAKK